MPDTEGARRFRANPRDKRHGTTNGYSNLRCRCKRCKAAWAESHKAYMHAHPEQQQRHRERSRELYHEKNPDAERRG